MSWGTQIINPLVDSRGQPLAVDIIANISNRSQLVNGKRTFYRRNNLSISCGFTFKAPYPTEQVYLCQHTYTEWVQGYAVSIGAETAPGKKSQALLQCTAKRDKSPEPVSRQAITPHQPSHTFERIQFQHATGKNGRRPGEYVQIVVKLEVYVVGPDVPGRWVEVAMRQSDPIIVRGRPPSYFKRREGLSLSSSNTGPEDDSGPAGLSIQSVRPPPSNAFNSASPRFQLSQQCNMLSLHPVCFGTTTPNSSHRVWSFSNKGQGDYLIHGVVSTIQADAEDGDQSWSHPTLEVDGRTPANVGWDRFSRRGTGRECPLTPPLDVVRHPRQFGYC